MYKGYEDLIDERGPERAIEVDGKEDVDDEVMTESEYEAFVPFAIFLLRASNKSLSRALMIYVKICTAEELTKYSEFFCFGALRVLCLRPESSNASLMSCVYIWVKALCEEKLRSYDRRERCRVDR